MAQRVRTVRSNRARGGGAKPRVIGPFSILAEKLLILAAVAGGGALAYLIYGLMSGHITSFPTAPGGEEPLSELAQATLVTWVETATKILAWSAVVGTLLALARYYDSGETIWATGAVGGLLYLGLPALASAMLAHHYRSPNELTDTIALGVQAAGKVILVLAAARGAVQVFVAATRRPRRVPLRRAADGATPGPVVRRQSLLRQCWELSGCRGHGSACPSLRQRRSCWKRGSGCLCDLNLAEKLATGAEAWAHEEVTAIRYRTSSQGTRCLRCPIYEEHQEYKFRLLQWLAYPATVAGMFVSLPALHVGYERSLEFIDRVVAGLMFTPGHLRPALDTGGVESMVLSSNVEWVFIGCLGLLAVSYVLQGLERAIFRWGW